MGKKIIFSEEQKQDMIEMYKQGYTQPEIAQKYNVCRDMIMRVMKEYNIPKWKHRRVPDELRDKIISDYNDGMTEEQVSKKYHKNIADIRRILYDNNVEIHNFGNRGVKKWTINENYFDSIDTPNKAYVLGLLYADGYNNEQDGYFRIRLTVSDRDILEKIGKEIGSNKPLRVEEIKQSGKYKSRDCCILCINNLHMSQRLAELGVTQGKSLVCQFPKWLDEKLYPAFFRGVFDGDGWITQDIQKRSAGICGSRDFIRDASIWLETHLGVKCRICVKNDKTGFSEFNIGIRGGVYKFLDYIYTDADLYLDRKYQIYCEKYINNTLTA
jgi:uncharacterized protein (DUF433 family)